MLASMAISISSLVSMVSSRKIFQSVFGDHYHVPLSTYHIEVTDNFVEETKTLMLPIIVATHLEELIKVHDGSKHDAGIVVAFIVQVLKVKPKTLCHNLNLCFVADITYQISFCR